MERNAKFTLTLVVTLLLLGIIGTYSYYKFRDYILGPQITIESPENGATLAEPLIDIRGVAKNIAFITLNDGQIFVDEKGHFDEKLLVSPGYTIMKLWAKDRFGRTIEKKLELVYTPSLLPVVETSVATTTP
jgi:hypothetical protein